MDILKLSIDWAKSEIFSSAFFIIFGIIFVWASLCFWQLGKTDLARAYIIPTCVAGVLLLIIGIGLVWNNISRVKSFEKSYNNDTSGFVQSEIARSKDTLKEYQTVVFTAIPLIIIVCALLIIFIDAPVWRASLITTIAMLSVILLVDGSAWARMQEYSKQLTSIEK